MALILFDFDGVLADTLDHLIRFGQQACDRLGVAHTASHADLSSLEVMSFATYGRACEVPEHQIDSFVQICLNLFAEETSPPAIFDGLGEVIQRLAVNHKIAIVTSNSSQNVNAFLQKHGLTDCVHAIYGVDTPGSKAQKIMMARENLSAGAPRDSVFMVGDSLSDMLAAREAGVSSIAVAWGHQSLEQMRRGNPGAVVHTPRELLEAIGQ